MDRGNRSLLNIGRKSRTFYTAVVVEVFPDPDDLDHVAAFRKKVSSQDSYLLASMPRNSVIAHVEILNSNKVIYPFFPQHFSLPLLPGDHVWVMFPGGLSESIEGYYFCKKSTKIFSDDLNHQFNPRTNRSPEYEKIIQKRIEKIKALNPDTNIRKSNPGGSKDIYKSGGKTGINDVISERLEVIKQRRETRVKKRIERRQTRRKNRLDFIEKKISISARGSLNEYKKQNVPENEEIYTFKRKDIVPHKTIREESVVLQEDVVFEPVPRYTKKASETVIQGSNNTLISLTQNNTPMGGIISLITGRKKDEIELDSLGRKIVTNDLGHDEIDKIQREGHDPSEGEKNFLDDAAQIHLFMKEKIDKNTGIICFTNQANYIPEISPSQSSETESGVSDIDFEETPTESSRLFTNKEGSGCLIRTDHIRLNANSEGSIRLICDKTNNAGMKTPDVGYSSIMIENGDVEIVSTGEIRLGSVGSVDKTAVRAEDLIDLLGDIIDQIKLITVPTGVGPSGTPVNFAAFDALKQKFELLKSKSVKVD